MSSPEDGYRDDEDTWGEAVKNRKKDIFLYSAIAALSAVEVVLHEITYPGRIDTFAAVGVLAFLLAGKGAEVSYHDYRKLHDFPRPGSKS